MTKTCTKKDSPERSQNELYFTHTPHHFIMKKIHIEPLGQHQIHTVAEIFLAKYDKLKARLPSLPNELELRKQLFAKLERMANEKRGVAAIHAGKLVGYLAWVYDEDLHYTKRRGAYCPEWAHAAIDADSSEVGRIYQAMYRAAAGIWSAVSCQVHALTYLANDKDVEKFLYWNGFGMVCVDALRSINIGNAPYLTDAVIRKAAKDDSENIALLENEHWQHYTQPIIYMASTNTRDGAEIERFLEVPQNSYWLAEVNKEIAAFLRFEGVDAGNNLIVRSKQTTTITGAYTRLNHRGHGYATALLHATIQDYTGMGYQRCAVDFESINPEASAYWPKYFQPVCYSAIRHPESYLKTK